ncbi:acyl-CoA dehydrogenase NM domain-like protein [Mycena epipterygia]|nr:acyl-CoA dehydrogenase NM domain-like protein [Mycena epipterygia]
MHRSLELSSSPLFQAQSESLPWHERISLSYKRAKLSTLTADDVLNVSPSYWEFHTDPILMMDGAVATLLTIHYNLCVGTITMFPAGKQNILKQLLSFEVSGKFCMTELGHGLDAIQLETTATLLDSGELELNTPCDAAAKFMPPTTPCGIPCVAVVFARLIVDHQDRGVKPFLVPLHNGRTMYRGITSKVLSPRGASRPVQHALTYFRKVRLPGTALLGNMNKPLNAKIAFAHNISRVIVGTLSMGAIALSSMRIGSYVAGRYSTRRRVIDAATGKSKPILSFSTQKIPILTALAQTVVMRAFCDKSYSFFTSTQELSQKHFLAAVFKTTIVQHHHAILLLSVVHADTRSAAITEGDVLGISIRFTVDLILGRVSPPHYAYPDSVLAQHEKSMISELRDIVARSGKHRGSQMDSMILPQCQSLIEAVGHRIAYDAAIESGVDPLIVDLYVASVLKHDTAWYVEHANLPRFSQRAMERDSVEALYPKLDLLLAMLDVASCVTAPIVSDERWNSYVHGLLSFTGPIPHVVNDVRSHL